MNCYGCGDELTEENRSLEHVINNSIGGRLKSYKLICAGCNQKFGEHIDGELADQIGVFGDLLSIKRDRKKGEIKIPLITANGQIKLVGQGLQALWRLRVNVEGGDKEYFLTNKQYPKVLKDLRTQLSRKHKIEYKKYTTLPDKEKGYVQNKLSTKPKEIGFGGITYMRSIAKIALNYYLLREHDKSECKTIIDFVVNGGKDCPVFFYYPTNHTSYSLNEDEVSHVIHLKGSKQKKTLYAYLELFSMQKFIVIFNLEYEGESIDETYSYNVLTNNQQERKVNISLTKQHFENMYLIHEQTRNNVSIYLDRLLKIIEKRQVLFIEEDSI
ncbi:HNH endonuclease [Mucilaginibacter terrae]|uniref:HNH endonuclease 5 domain-containing protein n=1 Tax=Mucilaginibacter terrae TaxID=1955052 RepID=A0ABU3GVX9_9SPHI|nr:HNH endonuclease [Mucilaginibacter terrae]MDT3403825.1 hypothetical protein [Mucilaginibacter terrae]